jgi:hypothetical protein
MLSSRVIHRRKMPPAALPIILGFAIVLPLAPRMRGQAAPNTSGAPLTAAEVVQRMAEYNRAHADDIEKYAWTERHFTQLLKPGGAIAKTEDETFEVSVVDGKEYREIIARNGKPLTAAEQAKEDAKFQKKIADERETSPEERARKRQKLERETAQTWAEIPRAFSFSFVEAVPAAGSDGATGGDPAGDAYDGAYVIQGAPVAGYKASDDTIKMLQHLSGTLWINRQNFALERVQMNVVHPLSFGWFLFRLDSGGQVTLDLAPVGNDRDWMVSRIGIHASGRALFKHLRMRGTVELTNYREFRVDSRIIGIARK